MLIQGTDEWRLARCGSIGSSDMPRLTRKVKSGGWSADRDQLMGEKFMERLTRVPHQGFKSAAMLQGNEREPIARLTYELIRGVEIVEVGLVRHPSIEGAHASPDGLIGDHGLVEIKCPLPAAHLEALDNEKIPPDHMTQMQWQMACTDRAWCDYVSFNPDFPATMQLWVRRVARNQYDIDSYTIEAKRFIRELEDRIERLTRRYGRLAA